MTSQHNPVLDAAKLYLQRNWHLVLLGEKEKTPDKYKWLEHKFNQEEVELKFAPGKNIGVALGGHSGGLIDIDFDSAEAASIGNLIFADLPGFGRKSAPSGHRIAICHDAKSTIQFSLTKEQAASIGFSEAEKSMVLEVRSTGGYTMFPPSCHPCGEILDWHSGLPEKITEINWDTLVRKAGTCAFLAIVLRAYPIQKGNRDNICLALTGALLRAEWSPEDTDRIVSYIALQKNDEEADKRGKATATKEKLDAGQDVTGLPTLCTLLGIEELQETLHKWLYGVRPKKDKDNYIEELNKIFFVVESEGGKCRIAFFEDRRFERKQTRSVLVIQTFHDFSNRYMNQQIEIGRTDKGQPIYKALGKYWLEHPKRRQYSRIDFLPSGEVPVDVYNLWQGFAYTPQKGQWRYMQRHIWHVLAKRNKKAFRYIVQWAAWAVQNPGEPAEVALVFKGGKGTGKGTFCRWLKILFGQHGLQIFSAEHISGRFNGHLQDCVLLFADEAIAPNDRNAEAILKGFLTEPTLPMERKGYDVTQVPNHLHVVMASNSDWVVPASGDERRFAVFEVSNEKTGQHDWFERLNEEMENGGAKAMLHFLLNLNLGGWHPRKNIPENSALTDQRIQSLRGPEKIWFNWLSTADTPCKLIDRTPCIPTTTFAELAHINVTAAGRFLSDMGFQKDENSRPRSWIAPQLKEARIIWNQKKFKVDWDDTEAWLGSAEPPF